MKKTSDGSKVIAMVESSKARFTNGVDMGIDFSNEIDAWTKMEVVFRRQIKDLKSGKKTSFQKIKPSSREDLRPLRYSIREKVF